MARDTLSRTLHDVGLSAWFGGTLANAVALNPASAEADRSRASGAVANVGWDRWTLDTGAFVGMSGFGASAPAADLYPHFGITAEAVAAAALEITQWEESVLAS